MELNLYSNSLTSNETEPLIPQPLIPTSNETEPLMGPNLYSNSST